jgi:hypothetical protein
MLIVHFDYPSPEFPARILPLTCILPLKSEIEESIVVHILLLDMMMGKVRALVPHPWLLECLGPCSGPTQRPLAKEIEVIRLTLLVSHVISTHTPHLGPRAWLPFLGRLFPKVQGFRSKRRTSWLDLSGRLEPCNEALRLHSSGRDCDEMDEPQPNVHRT